ncbi:Tn3 family transposase [Sphaerisporangium sp. NPDC004334]
MRGKTLSGRNTVIHGGQVLSTYTHVSDQWSTYGTKIIVLTAREAHYVLARSTAAAVLGRGRTSARHRP